ncbi:MAG: sulfatase-like hydrolase/transferase [Verrucomicrobiales bacterium]|nr:sulfatase-like hydrolase/transferase [Verrucomicrobiales bacterium]
MTFFRTFFCIFAGLFFASFTCSGSEWIDLFDGKTTAGWAPRTETTVFKVENGEIHLDSEKNCWVTSDREMANFEAEVEVLTPGDATTSGFNSGFAFRCINETGKPKGYQVEIDGKIPGMSGGVFGIGLGGWLYPKNEEKAHFTEQIQEVIKKGEWNHYRVICQGPKITTFVNGKKIAEVESSASLKGFFAIQHHGKGGVVKFRNIRARELPDSTADHPNILWITVEDMSPTLGCYGDTFANTPTLDQFAKESVLYTNAFAASPVCSPSRSTLITGLYNASMGTNQMRSANHIPTGVRGFPSYLREVGYHTTNNVKTDYNCAENERLTTESWNESSADAHWRSKKEKQPFFAVFNDMTTHQSRTMVWPYAAFKEHVQSRLSAEEINDPAKTPIPPYYPDTEEVRRTMARFYDCVAVMDKNVKRILDQLEDDGLADDTIVFFYSDHGSGMPRHKRLLLDSGMRVPLMVRFPEKYRHLAPEKPGTKTDRLVSFVDFPATVLNLTGQPIPEYMQGIPFLGPDSDNERSYIYGTRDRVDEVFEMARSVRDKQYLYIRNYMPHLSYNQPSVFSDLGEIRTSIKSQKPDKMSKAQLAYAGPDKPVEEFYDCIADPMNLNNLLEGELSEDQKEAFDRLKTAFQKSRNVIQDVGVLPESIMRSHVEEEGMPIRDILTGSQSNHAPDLKLAWKNADLVGTENRKELLELLSSAVPQDRYWAIIGMRVDFPGDSELHEKVVDHLDDISPDVRIETASWLADRSEKYRDAALAKLIADTEHENWWTALRACRSIELLGLKAKSLLPRMEALYAKHRHQTGDQSFFLAFSSGAFLDQFGSQTEPWDFSPGAGSFSADPKKKKQ